MKTIYHSAVLLLSAAALLGAAATSRAAGPFSLDFEGPGSLAEAFAPSFLTIGYGQYVPFTDGFGDDIPGSDHWELDLSGGSVPVIDPSTVGFGAAPSGTKALDVRDGPVLLVFDVPFSFTSFTATLDNSTIGGVDPAETAIKFYDAANQLIYTAPANQSIPGTVVNVGPLNNVKTVLLPPTAFYDNIAAVPEPGAAVSLLGGFGVLFAFRRRR